jgi:hypothetical protein
MLTPEDTPEPRSQGDRDEQPDTEIVSLPKGWYQIEPGEDVPDRRSNNASRRDEIDSQIDTSNVTETRTRRTPRVYYTAFIAALQQSVNSRMLADQPRSRLHRDQLPPPPKRWKQLQKHPFGAEFQKAAAAELQSCRSKGCLVSTTATRASVKEEVLPLMWVFAYKFDEDGYLYKFKARLVVRGDLQEDWGDTYAATLAARVFRFLIALAAAFGLRAYQYDVINAFLNASLDRLLYAYTPEGFVHELGELLEMRRALYGLRDAPLLWYRHLKNTLLKLGLRPIKEVPCLFTSKSLIVFFYVDDIVILVHPDNLAAHRQFEHGLKAQYELRSLGQLR